MSLRTRFDGETGRRILLEELTRQKMVDGDKDLAAKIADRVQIVAFQPAELMIEQNNTDNDIYLILSGVCDIVINGRPMAARGPGDHVGEMAAIQPTQTRSASVIPREETVAAKLSEKDFSELAGQHPQMYRAIARELARRLMERNKTVGPFRDKIRVFIISSVEALGVARTIQQALEHDGFHIEIWTDGVFKVANYTIESLEKELELDDFAIAIAHADDLTHSREQTWPAPRDNVIFELGLFMGRLGRKRAILMEPREEHIKLPSDLAGITTIPYRYEAGRNALSLMGPACTKLRDHINEWKAFNG